MATYAIGDIHGCWHTLQRLLRRIRFAPSSDRLLLTGDLVNRGPFSREVLLWARDHADSVHFVLGNHEIHLLGAALGAEGFREREALRSILEAPDAQELVDWVRTRPLLLTGDEFVLVHAGLLPHWTLQEAQDLASCGEKLLRGEGAREWLETSRRHGKRPPSSPPSDETLFLHAATLLRLVDTQGRMVENFVRGEDEIPPGALPWFDAPRRKWSDRREQDDGQRQNDQQGPNGCWKRKDRRVIFGHWAMLGLMLREDAWCLDSGCVWGGTLSAVRMEDGEVFQESRAPEDAPKS